jgi:hypothetical protein
VFDDHEDHARESIPPWAQVKPCAGGVPRTVNPGLRQSPMGLERTPSPALLRRAPSPMAEGCNLYFHPGLASC